MLARTEHINYYVLGHSLRCENKIIAPIAQLVEQLPFKQVVAGSSPAGRTYVFCFNFYHFRSAVFTEKSRNYYYRALGHNLAVCFDFVRFMASIAKIRMEITEQ